MRNCIDRSGDTVDYNGKVSREPVSGSLINADILDTAYYDGCRIDSSLAVGDAVFGDRTAEKCAVSEMPVMPENTEILLTPCDAKASSSEQAEVTAAKDITLIVGFDSRMEKVPSWVSGWNKESGVIKTSNDIVFELYSKKLKAGETVTLGANGQSAGCMNYIVIAAEGEISTVRGDVNADGRFDTADLVLMQKWLLNVPDTVLKDWKAGDLCEDGQLDVFDLINMRKEQSEKM